MQGSSSYDPASFPKRTVFPSVHRSSQPHLPKASELSDLKSLITKHKNQRKNSLASLSHISSMQQLDNDYTCSTVNLI